MKSCHEELSGGHFEDKRKGYKVISIGYYWPNIFQDAKNFVKGCDRCQRLVQPLKLDEMQPQIVIEPFEKWALDFVGPINPSSQKRSYIFFCTDYVTKWVKEKALSRAT